MTRTALALVLLGAQAWAAPVAAVEAPAAKKTTTSKASAPKVRGKAQAPVSVDAVLGAGSATVVVRFDRAVTDATVGVHGVDGLAVTSDATPVSGARFAAGQAITFDVAFTPGPGESHLVVSVGGKFAGAQRNAVSTFAVGKPSLEQMKPAGTPAVDAEGNAVKVMPSGK
jgi:hypothetical protein